MTRYLSTLEVIYLHSVVIEETGGSSGIRDFGSLEASIALPKSTFDGQELYPTIISKAAALAHSLVGNHPFVDGNKRIGHAAMEAFLRLNHMQLKPANSDEQTFLDLASGLISRKQLEALMAPRIQPS